MSIFCADVSIALTPSPPPVSIRQLLETPPPPLVADVICERSLTAPRVLEGGTPKDVLS